MMTEDETKGFVDTTPQAGNGDQYRDPEHIPSQNEFTAEIKSGVVDSKSRTLAGWIRHKQWGVDVREALALFVEWLSTKWHAIRQLVDSNSDRQSAVESRQNDLENRFSSLLGSATKDSEVIDARDSQKYGRFNVLDARIENIEGLLAKYVPQGFEIKINHNMKRMPSVRVVTYDWAIGTEKDGLDTTPSGLFGGTQSVSVAANTQYPNTNSMVVILPMDYQTNVKPIQRGDDWYLISGIKTIKISLF